MENSKSKSSQQENIVQPVAINNVPPVAVEKGSLVSVFHKDPKFFGALGIVLLSFILFGCTLGAFVRGLPSAHNPTEQAGITKKGIPVILDASREPLPQAEIVTRVENIYKALDTTKIENTTGSHSVEKLAITHWNSPLESKPYKEGDNVQAQGIYTIPEDSVALITVTANDKVIGTQLINNTAKAQETKDFSIDLGTYQKGKKEYRVSLDGVASCRLVCAPSDVACHASNTNYCGTDFTNQRMVAYTPRTVGIADLYTDKTCLMKEFRSGPSNTTSVDSCATEGFQNPYFIDATAFINAFKIPVSTKQTFAQDLTTYYSTLTSGQGNTAISRNQGEASWAFDYKKSTENDTGMCLGKVTVKVYCPKE